MKRHIRLLIGCLLCGSSLLMAQDAYGPTNDGDTGSRDFHINPGNMMNRMPNPMQGFWGSSNRRYSGYDDRYTAPPVYPPAYGYPASQPPYGYGYSQPYPQTTAPIPLAPQPTYRDRSAQVLQQPDTSRYRPHDNVAGFRFRPMGETKPTPTLEENGVSYQRYPTQENLAPIEYPAFEPASEPLDPLTFQEAQAIPTPADKPAPEIVNHEGKTLKFRPLDQPGYSPDLGE